jgi:type VI secretion system protein ImpM
MCAEPVKVVGYYGKLPSHGDFVTRGLPNTFIDTWDIWLQEAIHTSKQQLGDNWLNYYLTSPLYRFVLSPGICGDSAWMGTLMPSVDKIGRYYPMTISLKNDFYNNPFSALQNNNDWFEQIESLTLSCLEDNFNLENFYQKVCQLNTNSQNLSPENTASLFAQMSELDFPDALRLPLDSIKNMPDVLSVILDKLLKNHCLAYSVWWTRGSEHISPSILICTGLPPFDGIAAMFDGNWQQRGWEGKHFSIKP